MTREETASLEEQLAAAIGNRIVVMGIGNPLRGDDAAGSLVAKLIPDAPDVRVIDAQDLPEDYLPIAIRHRPDTVVLIDSVDMRAAPGSVALLDAEQFTTYWPSTHHVPIGVLMNVLEQETRARVFVIGIQPAQTQLLQPVTSAVRWAVADLAAALSRALARRGAAA